MPVITKEEDMYNEVAITSVPTIPIGRSFFGFFTSPANVVTESKPIKEKKTFPAPKEKHQNKIPPILYPQKNGLAAKRPLSTYL